MSQRARRARERQRARRNLGRLVALGVVGIAALVGLLAVIADATSDEDGGRSSEAAASRLVRMTEFAFDPDPIVLAAGDDPVLEVVNDGDVAHDLVVLGLGKGTPDLPPGERFVLDLSGQPPGTYRVVCDLPGHTEAGMVTELRLG